MIIVIGQRTTTTIQKNIDYCQRTMEEIHNVYRLLSTDSGGNTRRLPITFNGLWRKYMNFTEMFQRTVAKIHDNYRWPHI